MYTPEGTGCPELSLPFQTGSAEVISLNGMPSMVYRIRSTGAPPAAGQTKEAVSLMPSPLGVKGVGITVIPGEKSLMRAISKFVNRFSSTKAVSEKRL